ncbi:MAG: hypothetical protein LBK99_09920 [Opitutaceae bacterium]|jgi:hypothetical protein|nr:hypothetical protein [Opitutaceae bacterium]
MSQHVDSFARIVSTELQYWYVNSSRDSVVPDRSQTERLDNSDPFPSLVWCTWPNYPSLGAPHSGGRSMNVLDWNGRVRAVPHTEWRSGGYP